MPDIYHSVGQAKGKGNILTHRGKPTTINILKDHDKSQVCPS